MKPRPGLRKWLRRGVAGALAATGLVLIGGYVTWRLCPFPVGALEDWPKSPLVLDRDGRVVLAAVGEDGQWRMPVPLGRTGPWVAKATIAVEDERFYSHPGVDPIAVARACVQDVTRLRIVSGASTITMQVARMAEPGPRGWRTKVRQSFRALQLEQLQSKGQILETYLNIAPYGGNLRGVEAASWRYFGKPANALTLDESALLAGLPASPERTRPDRHPDAAIARRNAVLRRMEIEGYITSDQRRAAESTPLLLTDAGHDDSARHIGVAALAQRPQGGVLALDPQIQDLAELGARRAMQDLPKRSEVSVVVIDVARSRVVAMVGSPGNARPDENQVNGALAWRSPGSVLKAFIYAAAVEDGRLAPETMLTDAPLDIDGWSPRNFSGQFAGPVRADEALRRSLNIPAIVVCRGVGVPRCRQVMEASGVRFRRDPVGDAGLSLAVGGTEVRLLDLTNAFATIARQGCYAPAGFFADDETEVHRVLSPGTCAVLDSMLSSRSRAPAGFEGASQGSTAWFMWKTGTSSGRRDAWAVGHNGAYAAGVWVGDFSGTSDGEYVSRVAAEPLLASLFNAPRLRRDQDPPAPAPVRVTNAITDPRSGGVLRIVEPPNRAEFLSEGGASSVFVKASGRPSHWFLNGSHIRVAGEALTLSPGTYELRCVDPAGSSDSVSFIVR